MLFMGGYIQSQDYDLYCYLMDFCLTLRLKQRFEY